MGLHAPQLRELIVRPALEILGMHSDAAEDLVMGTAAQESRLKYVKQLGTGPALSIFQIEPNTYYDYWENYLKYQPDVVNRIRQGITTSQGVPPAERMVWDLRFAAMMCRIHYRRVKASLPEYGDIWAYAAYWKEHYNTHLGAGTEQEFVDNFRLVQ